MLVSVVLELQPMVNASILGFTGAHVHGWFFEQLAAVNPTLAGVYHDSVDRKPFSVTSIWTRAERYTTNEIQLFVGDVYYLKISSLTASLSKCLLNELIPRWLSEPVTLVGVRFVVRSIHSHILEHPLAYKSSYDAFIEHVMQSPLTPPSCLAACWRSGISTPPSRYLKRC